MVLKTVSLQTERAVIIARIWNEAFLAGRFALVGITATMVHMLVVWMLIELGNRAPLLANLAAFLTAFVVSFTGHYFWTFQVPGHLGRAARRFFMISGSAFAINTGLLAVLLEVSGLSDSVSAVLAAIVTPVITFAASRLWGFSPSNEKQRMV
ncbi:MAG TPA: GtrA family protein [Candidatus Competibacteraceae bacterium]|nr:GtrA family protein [Candidatus Competibacteraceae bacterium]